MRPPTADFAAWLRDVQSQVEAALGEALPPAALPPQRLHDAMRYATLGGGKRIRPTLVFAAGALTCAACERLRVAAAAIELLHCYSLVHDDLPCMDDDAMRRGKPSCHTEYDEATALLVGDSLQSLAFQLVSETPLTDNCRSQLAMVRLIATAVGSKGMAGGQAIDLAAVGRSLTLPELEMMHVQKTGALIRASVLLGAACGAPLSQIEQERLDRYAKHVGLAFQIIDDVLDSEADSATLGKTAGKDARAGKPTYVTVLGAGAARELAFELYGQAIESLGGFGDRARRLQEIAAYVVKRQH